MKEQEQARMKHTSQVISLGVLSAAFALVCLSTHFFIVDDAYISFRYAHNLSVHGELVFNLGERVEGFTNMLWTLLLTLLALLRLPLEPLTIWISLTCIGFAMFRLWQLGPLLGSTMLAGTLAASMLVLNPSFVGATANGMEAALYSALLAETVYRFARDQRQMSLLCASLLFMTRPEAFAIAMLLLILSVKRPVLSPHNLVLAACIFIPAIALTGFRLLYYGTAIPNTVVAKSFPLSTLPSVKHLVFEYLGGFCITVPYLVLAFLASCVWLLTDRKWRESTLSLGVFCVGGIGLSWLVAIRNAGDWMPHFRLLSQYGVLYSVLLILLMRHKVVSVAMALAIVAFPLTQTISQTLKQGTPSRITVTSSMGSGFWADTSARLLAVATREDRVSAEALGYISYQLPDVQFQDPCGLTDRYLARHGNPEVWYGKSDNEYLLRTVRPSVMVWQWPGHLSGTDQALLDQYTTFSYQEAAGWDSDVVMIRNDRLDAIGPAFSDWHPVKIRTHGLTATENAEDM